MSNLFSEFKTITDIEFLIEKSYRKEPITDLLKCVRFNLSVYKSKIN